MNTDDKLLAEAKAVIAEFCRSEYGSAPDDGFRDTSHIPLAYTTTEDGVHEIRAIANLDNCTLSILVDSATVRTEHYQDLRDMIDNCLNQLDFDSLAAVFDEKEGIGALPLIEVRTYSHDYPDDTKLIIQSDGQDNSLTLTFRSEDADMGYETMYFNGDGTIDKLMTELRDELTSFLDRQDHSSFYAQQGIPADGIHSSDDYYGEFSRTALYAFEGMLKEQTLEQERPMTWHPIEANKCDWLYSSSGEDEKRGCIGHVRGDFGHNGKEFWTSWFSHQRELNTTAFQQEIQTVINRLREKGALLDDLPSMRLHCREGTPLEESYGFRAESRNYEYCLRCKPVAGDYNFYLYCYDKQAQRAYARENPPISEQLKAAPTPTHKTDKKKEMER